MKQICFHCKKEMNFIPREVLLQDDFVQIYQWNHTKNTNASLFFHAECFNEIAGLQYMPFNNDDSTNTQL